MTAGNVPLAGVIGKPIAHSRSPLLHGFWLRRYRIVGHYVPLLVEQSDLPTLLDLLPRLGFVGLNVTVPLKEAILPHVDIVSDRAAVIGAANTLIFRKDGRIHADNTDGIGFLANLQQEAPGWSAATGPAAVIGAGGAARAVISALLEAGAPEIRLTNRTRARAEALRSDFGARIIVVDWVRASEMLDGATTVVNTSLLGMNGKPELTLALDHLATDALVTDIVYTPLQTGLLRSARLRGCTVVDGLGMLLHQAVPGFERWFGVKPQVDAETRAAVLA